MVASNIFYYWEGAAQFAAGTSFATPLWAGLTALINQNADDKGALSVGFLNPSLYAIAPIHPFLHDITSGNNVTPWNTQPGHDQQYPAVIGYDLVTGWGSPMGMTTINALTPPRFDCSALAELIISLREQQTKAEKNLTSPECAGPAQFECVQTVHMLGTTLSSETKIAQQFHCPIPPN